MIHVYGHMAAGSLRVHLFDIYIFNMGYNCVRDETSLNHSSGSSSTTRQCFGTTRIRICQLAISLVADGVVVALDAKQCDIEREKL
jgi:hypothetical protein